MNKTKSFTIVGGGIGGLTLAIGMQRRGFRVKVYENAHEIKPLGAGLGLGANAVKAFFEIGIGDEILEARKDYQVDKDQGSSRNVLTETPSQVAERQMKFIHDISF